MTHYIRAIQKMRSPSFPGIFEPFLGLIANQRMHEDRRSSVLIMDVCTSSGCTHRYFVWPLLSYWRHPKATASVYEAKTGSQNPHNVRARYQDLKRQTERVKGLGICTSEPVIVTVIIIWPKKTLAGLLRANFLIVQPWKVSIFGMMG